MDTLLITAASSGTNIAPLLLSALVIGLLFFFMIVRPQKRNLAKHKAMVEALSAGDEIITSGGIYGTIKKVESESVELTVSDGVTIRVATRAIAMKKAKPADLEDKDEAS